MIFNQIVSCRFGWSLPQQANNRFRGREVKVSSIGILTDRSLVKMYYPMVGELFGIPIVQVSRLPITRMRNRYQHQF